MTIVKINSQTKIVSPIERELYCMMRASADAETKGIQHMILSLIPYLDTYSLSEDALCMHGVSSVNENHNSVICGYVTLNAYYEEYKSKYIELVKRCQGMKE